MNNMIRSAIAGAALCCAGAAWAADLVVHVADVKDKQGNVHVLLFDAQGFPENPLQDKVTAATLGTTSFAFTNLAPGDYAFVAYHDLNGNDTFDMDDTGAPAEPFAVSKEPPMKGAPPAFDSARIALTARGTSATVRLAAPR